MAWLGNGYTKADYDGSTRTAYLDTAMIDYPPLPEIQSELNTNGATLTPAVKGLDKCTVIDHVISVSTV